MAQDVWRSEDGPGQVLEGTRAQECSAEEGGV